MIEIEYGSIVLIMFRLAVVYLSEVWFGDFDHLNDGSRSSRVSKSVINLE